MTAHLDHTLTGFLANEAHTLLLGEQVAERITVPAVVYLNGQLGAGKTTFSRGFLRARGHAGSVKSPTYTIVEPYEALPGGPVFHMDLYRLSGAGELEYLGLDDYLHAGGVLLVEWPERADGHLPLPTVLITLTPEEKGRHVSLRAADEAVLEGLVI
jgi:tRNA threonylcarbamoyladenosine biosynthesis protein TsaE